VSRADVVVVERDALRRLVLDLDRSSGPCDCWKCVKARNDLRVLAWGDA
jgi:hypothetical protein